MNYGFSCPFPYRDRQDLVRKQRTEGQLSGAGCSEGPKLAIATHPVLLRSPVSTNQLGVGVLGCTL